MVVEDEPLARTALTESLDPLDWIDLVGCASDGAMALEMVDRLRPDLMFLDVHMPELSGLEVAMRMKHEPAIVFTTAYDRHAVAAFELQALDYLLKPFGQRRLEQALARVRRQFAARRLPPPPSVERLGEALATEPLRRVLVRDGDALVPVEVDDVTHISAEDDYAMLHTASGAFLVNVGLGNLAQRLPSDQFLRIHRSHLVNVKRIERIVPHDDRRLVVRVQGGSQILASRAGSQLLRGLII